MTEVSPTEPTSNLPITEDLPTEKRVYLGGISSQLTNAELEEKLSRFGKIIKNLEISEKFKNSNIKFGFLTILISLKNWKNLLSTLNNSNWKGSKLKIQEAKPSTFDRITKERENSNDNVKEVKIRKRIMSEHSKNFDIINIDNYETNTNWKKLRFDKIIRSMKIRKPNGIILNYDPKNYQKNFKKFKNDDEISNTSLIGLNWEDISTPVVSESSDYSSSDSDDNDSSSSGEYESDRVEEELSAEKFAQDEEMEVEVQEGVEENDSQNIAESSIDNQKPSTIEELNKPPSIIQQLANKAQELTPHQPIEPESTQPQVQQEPEPEKPKTKIDLIIDSIINDEPELPKEEPKKIFRRRVTKQKPKNTEEEGESKPSASSFSFNFNFGA